MNSTDNPKIEKAEKDYAKQRQNILNDNSDFAIREAYKSLRTNILLSTQHEGCCKICVTSADSGDGKSISALNLAISFAELGKHVLLIDADLRRPNQANLLAQAASPGLSNILANKSTGERIINYEAFHNLDVIFSGDVPPNPSELLGNQRMEQLLEMLSKYYDYIFLDAPAVSVVTDAILLSRMVDGVLLVVRQGHSDCGDVMYAANQLKFAGAKLLGVVLNEAEKNAAARSGHNKYTHKYHGRGYQANDRAAVVSGGGHA
jgi:capsular exopolysaccharide synthesis family protein